MLKTSELRFQETPKQVQIYFLTIWNDSNEVIFEQFWVSGLDGEFYNSIGMKDLKEYGMFTAELKHDNGMEKFSFEILQNTPTLDLQIDDSGEIQLVPQSAYEQLSQENERLFQENKELKSEIQRLKDEIIKMQEDFFPYHQRATELFHEFAELSSIIGYSYFCSCYLCNDISFNSCRWCFTESR